MRRVGEDFPPPALDVERAMHEAVAQRGGRIGLLVVDDAEMIAGHLEAAAVELADPALDRNFPVGMAEEKAADHADADRLARRGRRRQRRRRKLPRHRARNHLAVDALQRAVVAALIGEQKRLAGAERLDQIALKLAGLDILAQGAQLPLIGRAAAGDVAFLRVDHRQFGETGGEARFGMAGFERQRLREIGGGLVVAAEIQQ